MIFFRIGQTISSGLWLHRRLAAQRVQAPPEGGCEAGGIGHAPVIGAFELARNRPIVQLRVRRPLPITRA
jgi:hypothetical protein